MSLPILQSAADTSVSTLIRHFHQTQRDWSRHFGEETVLDAGMAFHNVDLPKVWDANRVLDARMLPDLSAAQIVDTVNEHYQSVGATCRCWMTNVSAPIEQTQPLVDELLRQGFTSHVTEIMYLNRKPSASVMEVSNLKIIPSRASFKHARQLAEEANAKFAEPQMVEAAMLHLDDPHWDSVIALRDGKAVATAGVLTVGEIGLIENVFVSEAYRRGGIGRTMMSRALEICARGLLKHILLEVSPANVLAIELYQRIGFKKIGNSTVYLANP